LRALSARLRRAATGLERGRPLRAVALAYRAYAGAHPGVHDALQLPTDDPEHRDAAADLPDVLAAVLRATDWRATRRFTRRA